MILSVDHLGKRIGDRMLLDELSFSIEVASVYALCGLSGSGKTTLVRIISGLVGFDSGTLEIGATTISAGKPYPKFLYGKIGVIFQEHNLFPHMTALENIMLGLRSVKKFSKKDALDRGRQELEQVGLADKANQYPVSLSGGEQQRVAIARALAIDPVLLLLDEPTSGLDPSLIGEVFQIIRNLAQSGSTMLLITHNIKFAKETGNRFGILNDGKIQSSDDASFLDQMNYQGF